jgi:hypothetical protein
MTKKIKTRVMRFSSRPQDDGFGWHHEGTLFDLLGEHMRVRIKAELAQVPTQELEGELHRASTQRKDVVIARLEDLVPAAVNQRRTSGIDNLILELFERRLRADGLDPQRANELFSLMAHRIASISSNPKRKHPLPLLVYRVTDIIEIKELKHNAFDTGSYRWHVPDYPAKNLSSMGDILRGVMAGRHISNFDKAMLELLKRRLKAERLDPEHADDLLNELKQRIDHITTHPRWESRSPHDFELTPAEFVEKYYRAEKALVTPRPRWDKIGEYGNRPAEFIAMAYAPEMAAGTLHRGVISAEQPELVVKLASWLRSHPMPEGVRIPTQFEWNTNQIEAYRQKGRPLGTEETRLRSVLRGRRYNVSKGKPQV